MSKKTANADPSAETPKRTRKKIEKVFVVEGVSPMRLVRGFSQRAVTAAIYKRPIVRLATPDDIATAMIDGIHIEKVE